mmetsp:Transcript_29365/g.74858  ORF Transcript_29365/g.74858 Transcript_29365/m.74858 type:complete len:407 (+) Transcript_29365:363-1583(+)
MGLGQPHLIASQCIAAPTSNVSQHDRLLDQQLGDLHGVERGALLDLVAAHKQLQALLVVARDVAAHAAHKHIVLGGGVQGGGELVVDAVVDDGHAGRLLQGSQRLRLADVLLKLQVDGLGVRAHHGHTDAGGRDLDRLVLPDLVRLLDQLHLLLVVAQLDVHLGVVAEQVERVLLGEDLGVGGLAVQHIARLLAQLLHGGRTSAGRGLVGGHDHALDVGHAVQGGHGHQGNDGGAVGVGDDGALAAANLDVRHVLRVHLRHNQGHTLSHAEGGRVVHDNAASLSSHRAQDLGDGATSREQGNVHTLEALRSQLLDGVGVALELLLLASGPGRGQQLNVAVREVALLDDRQELLAHSASHANNGNLGAIGHLLSVHADATSPAGTGNTPGSLSAELRGLHFPDALLR